MSNGNKVQGPITPEEYGALIGGLLAQEASQNVYRDPEAERAGTSPLKTLGKYDEGATAAIYQPVHNADPEQLQAYYRGDKQAWWEQVGNAALAFVPGVALKTVQGIGHVGGAIASLAPNTDITGYDNAWVNAISNLDEKLREALPIHLTKAYSEGNLVQKMGTMSFWTKDFADGLEFMTSAMIPSGALGKIGSISKALSSTSRGAKLGKVLSDITRATGANTSNISATVYNTLSEAFFEAKDARDQVREAAARQNGFRSFEELPMDVRQIVDEQAADAAARVFTANAAALAIPNFFESKWAQSILGKKNNAAESLIRKQILSGETTADKIAGGISLRKQAFKGMMSEGLWEENIQAAIQQYEQRLASGELDPESTSILQEYGYGLFNNAWGFLRAIPDIATLGLLGTSAAAGTLQDEGATAVFLGGVLGGGMSTYAAHAENQALQEYAGKLETEWGKLLDWKKLTDKHFVDNINTIYKEFDPIEEGDQKIRNWINPKTGEKEYDVPALMRRAISDYRNVAYFNEGSMADAASDPLWQQYNLDMSLASWVYRMRNATDHAGLEELLQYRTEMEENAEGIGVLKENKDKVLAFSKAYDEAIKSTQGLEEFDSPEHVAQFNNIYKRLNFYAGIKASMLADLQVGPEAQPQLQSLVDDNNELIATLKKNKKKLQEDYLEAVKPLTFLKEQRNQTIKKFESEQDVKAAEQIGKDLTTIDYQIAEKEALEGLLLDSSVGDIYTADMRTGIEARHNEIFPYRRNRQFDIGKEALVQTSLSKASANVKAAPDLETKLAAAQDAIDTASLNKGYVGTSKVELTDIKQELEKLRTPIAKNLSELSKQLQIQTAKAEDTTTTRAQINEQTATRNAIDELINNGLTPLLGVAPTGDKYKGKPDLITVDDQSKYDFFKSTTPTFDSARKIVNDPDRLEKFENQQTIKSLEQEIASTEVVFNARTDISDALKTRVLNDLAQAKKDLEKLQVAFQANVNSRSLIQQQASQAVGEQFQAALNMKEVADVLKQIFGDKFANMPTEHNAATVTGVLAAMKSKMSGEQAKTLGTTLKTIKDGLMQQAAELGVVDKNAERLAASISKFAAWVTLGPILPKRWTLSNEVPGFVALFKETKNLSEFWAALENNNYADMSEAEKATILKWKKLVTQLQGVDLLQQALDTKLDLLDAFDKEKKEYAKTSKGKDTEEVVSPTAQQTIAIRTVLKFLLESKKGLSDNMAFIEGLAGTGKTRVVIGTVLRVYNALTENSMDSVYTMSHTAKSSEILHNELKTKGSPTNVETFLAKTDLSDIKILVIDEAPAINKLDMRKVLKKVEDYNGSVGIADQIKVIALGDPAQITTSNYPEISSPSRLGVRVTPPLTAVYRTNVGPIIEYFTAYRLQLKPVQEIATTVNADLSALPTTPKVVGVTGSTSNEHLREVAYRPSDTSKLIVVADEATARSYPPNPNVEVLAYDQVGGMQVDEVYIDIPRALFNSDFEYNKAIFTAVSRAKQFVYHQTATVTPTVNSNLQALVSEEAKDILENGEAYVNSLDETTNTINGLLGTKIKKAEKRKPAKKQDSDPKSTLQDELLQEEMDAGLEDPVNPPIVAPIDGGINAPPQTPTKPELGVSKGKGRHALNFVTNQNIRRSNKQLPDFTGAVRILPTTKLRGNRRIKVWSAFAELPGNVWREVGVLGDEDFKTPGTGQALLDAITKTKGVLRVNRVNSEGELRVQDQEEFDRATAMEASLAYVTPLTYRYSPGPNFTEGAEMQAPLDSSILKFFNNVATPLRDAFIGKNGKINWSKLKKYVKVGIFNWERDDATDEFSYKAATDANKHFTPVPGVPYIKIKLDDSLTKEKLGHGISQQYIRLQRKGISRDNPYYQDLDAYYQDYLAFKEETGIDMGTEEYSQALVEAAGAYISKKDSSGVPRLVMDPALVDTNTQALAELGITSKEGQELARKLAAHIYGPRFARLKFYSKAEAEDWLATRPDGQFKIDPDYSDGVGRVAILEKVSDEGWQEYKDWVVDPHGGKASKAFSNLAISNPMIGGKDVRVTKTYKIPSGSKTISTGKSLITSAATSPEFMRKFRKQYNEIREELNDWIATNRPGEKMLPPLDWNQDIDKAIKALGKVHEENGIGLSTAQWEEMRRSSITFDPITEDVFEAILNFEGDNHPDIEAPLLRKSPKDASVKEGINDLGADLGIKAHRDAISNQVYSNLQSVESSSVILEFDVVETSKSISTKNKLDNQLRNLPAGKITDLEGNPVYEPTAGIIANGLEKLTTKKYAHGHVRSSEEDALTLLKKLLSGSKFTGDFGPIKGDTAYSAWETGKFIIASDLLPPIKNGKLILNEIEIILNAGLSGVAQELANEFPSIIIKDFNGRVYQAEISNEQAPEVHTPPTLPPAQSTEFDQLPASEMVAKLATLETQLTPTQKLHLSVLQKALKAGADGVHKGALALYNQIMDERGINMEMEDPEGLTLVTKEQAIDLAKKLVPGIPVDVLNEEIGVKFVSRFLLQKYASSPKHTVYGRTLEIGQILLGEESGKVYKQALLHELFHYIYRNLMEEDERISFMASAERKFGSKFKGMTLNEREDHIANYWVDWFESDKRPSSSFVDRVLKAIKDFLSLITLAPARKEIEDFFKEFSTGTYTQERFRPWTGEGNNMSFILDNFGTINAYKIARDFILSRIKFYKRNGWDNLPVAREQAYILAMDDMKAAEVAASKDVGRLSREVNKIKKFFDFRKEEPKAGFHRLNLEDQLEIMTIFAEVYKTELPAAKLRQRAYSKALGHNVVTKEPIFFEIVKQEYRNWNVFSEQEIYKRAKLSELEDELLRANALSELSQTALRDQIEENENVDPSSRMSDSVKDYLSDITYTDTRGDVPVPKIVSPGFAFLKSLDTFLHLHLQNTTLEGVAKQVQYLRDRFVNSAAEKAVLESLMQDVIIPGMSADPTVTFNADDVNIVAHQPPGAKSVSYHLVYYDTAESILEGEERVSLADVLTLEEARRLSAKNNKIKVINMPLNNVDLALLYESAIDAGAPLDTLRPGEDTDEARQAFFDMFKRLEARNLLAEMQTLFGSQKETQLMIAQIENKYGELSVKYISAKELGIRVNLRRELATRISEFDAGLVDKKFKEGMKTYLKSSEGKSLLKRLKSTDQSVQMAALEEFLNFIGMKAYATTPAPSEIGDLAETTYKLLETISDQWGVEKEVPAVEQDGTVQDDQTEVIVQTVDDILEDQNDRLNKLARYLASGTELARASSVKDAEGKPVYKYNNSHYQYEIFNILHQISSDVFKGGAKARQYLNDYVPEFIKTSYFQKNIFTKGINKLFSPIGYHDAISQKDQGFTTTLDGETPYDRYTREFSAGFISQFKNSGGKYYRQFFYPPSHRSKVLNVQLGVLSPEGIMDAIEQAILQFREQNKEFENIKNWDPNDFTNFSILKRVLDANPDMSLDSPIDQLVDLVYEELALVSIETAQDIVSNKVALPSDLAVSQAIADKADLLDYEVLDVMLNEDVSRKLPPKLVTRKFNAQTQSVDYLAQVKNILPMIHLFVSNSYINGFFANQLALGDNRFYNQGDDIVKRNAGPSAAGQLGFFSPALNLPPKFRMGILRDSEITHKDMHSFLKQFLKGKELKEVLEYFSKKNVEITDAQGFMLPSRWEQLQKAYGRAYSLGNVMKPVHFQNATQWVPADLDGLSTKEIDALLDTPSYRENTNTGVVEKLISHPVYLKYSSIVLSDSLVERFPTLARLRYQMEKAHFDEMTFLSAVKVGAPTSTASLEDFMAANNMEELDVHSYDLDNQYYRMQLNPYSDVDNYVTIYSQLMYFLNILEGNEESAATVYSIVSSLIELGLTEAEELFNKTGDQATAIKNFIMKSIRSSDSQRARELLEAGIDVNNPVIEQKAITAIASGIEKLTTKIKFKGSKVVLQSSYGLANYGNIEQLDKRTLKNGKRLQYKKDPKTGRFYAEVIFPSKYLSESQKNAIKRGESLFAVEDMFGFRIPSTELHSAVPLRIVDYYDDHGTNVIIAPRELVPLHGSDFDVDSLFIVERERLTSDVTLPPVEGSKGKKYSKETYIGYKQDKNYKLAINTQELAFLDTYINAAETQLLGLPKKTKDEDIKAQKTELRTAIREASRLRKMFLRNYITETMLSVITAPRNLGRMLTPISMTELETLAKARESKENLDLNHPVQRHKAFELVQHGKRLVGAFANDVKSLAYMLHAGEDGGSAQLKEKLQFKYSIGGEVHEAKQIEERDVKGKQTWQRFDAAINAAIDNVKVLILPRLGVTTFTGKAFAGLLGVGVPLEQIVDLINHPIIKALQGPDAAMKTENAIYELRKKFEKQDTDIEATALDFSKLDTQLDLSKMSKWSAEELQLAYNILDVFRRGHLIGKSLSEMSKFLNIVREFPTTAEGLEDTYQAYQQIFKINENFEETLAIPDSLQLSGDVKGYLDRKEVIGDNSVEMNGAFAFVIPTFFASNPHIFSTWKTFLKLRNLIKNNFLLHSAKADAMIEEIGMFGEEGLRLDKGMPDKSAAKNKVLQKRELAKYILTQVYAQELEDEKPYTYTNRYGLSRTLYTGSAFSQKFAQQILALKKWNKAELVNNPRYKGNTFLQNISVVKTAGVNLWTIRFSKGTSTTQAEIEELQADFEQLRNLVIEKGKVRRRTSAEKLQLRGYSDLQQDFVKYSVINYGFKFSAANYAYFLPPGIYQWIDNKFAEQWSSLVDNKVNRDVVKDHFEISMVAHHRDKLKYIPRSKAEPIANGSQVIDLGYDVKSENNYSGQDFTDEGIIHYDRKFKLSDYNFPTYFREGDGYKATAFRKVHVTPEGEGARYVYYQRVGRPIDNTYQTAPKPEAQKLKTYSIETKFSPNRKYVAVDSTKVSTVTFPYDVSELEGDTIYLTDRNDYARMKARPVQITAVKKSGTEWVATVKEITPLQGERLEFTPIAENVYFTSASEVTTLEHILNDRRIVEAYKDTPIFTSMLKRVKDFADIKSLPVHIGKITTNTEKVVGGVYTPPNKGIRSIHLGDINFEWAAVHEITHAYTQSIAAMASYIDSRSERVPGQLYQKSATSINKRIKETQKLYSLTSEEVKFIKDIIPLYNKAQEVLPASYALKNIKEFVAEAAANPTFREQLSNITVDSKTIWEQIVDLFKSLLKAFIPGTSRSLLESVEAVVEQYIMTQTTSVNEWQTTSSAVEFDSFQQTSEEFQETEHPDTKRSVYERAGKLFTRVSDVVDIFKNMSTDTPWYTWVAKKLWGNNSPETIIHTDEGHMTMAEYEEILKTRDTKGKMRGKVIHAIIQQYLFPQTAREVQKKIDQYLKEGDLKDFQFKWVHENITKILKSSGLNIFDGVSEEELDQVLAEVTVGDESLGIAGTIDMLVKHANGRYSIIDFKTGFNFAKPSMQLLKYFDGGMGNRDVTTSQRDTAGLQVAWYAFLMKLNNPDIKFENLRVRWIASEHHIDSIPHLEKVDIETYLSIIQQFLSREPQYKEAWETIKSRPDFAELFSASTYFNGYSPRVIADIKESDYSPEQQAEVYLQKLKELTQYRIVSTDDNKKFIDKSIITLTEDLTQLLGDKDIDYAAIKQGSTFFDEWVGNMYDSTDPYVQLAVRFYEERKQRADVRYDTAYKGFLARLTPVYRSYQKRNGLAVLDKIAITKGALNFTNYEGLYDPLFKIIKDGENITRVWNQTEEDWADARKRYAKDYKHTLTDQEIQEYKNLLQYMKDQYEQFYVDSKSMYKNPEGKAVALWNRIATSRTVKGKDRLVTNGELFNGQTAGGDTFSKNARAIPFAYNKDTFMPLVPITSEEIRHRSGGAFTKEYLDYLKERYGSMYVERYFEQWYNDEMALPFKYLPNEKILADNTYSLNVELQFDKFMRAMIYKEELDDVYALYKGLQYSLEAKDASTVAPAFAGSAELLKVNAEMQIRGRTQRQFKSRLFRRGVSKDWIKILGTVQSVVAAPIMWLKPITGTANGVFTYMYTVKEAVKGSVITKLTGIDNHAADFTSADLAWATAQYFDMQKDAMLGNLRSNKMFLFLKRFGYLPDTYKWATDRNQLLTIRNKAISSSAMYMFHTIPEEAVAAMIMAAQLRNMKVSATHETHKNVSLWDMYDVEEFTNSDGTKFSDVVWKKDKDGKPIVRGWINTSKSDKPNWKEVTELTSREVQRMRYVYQRMHGGYRQDERTKLEYFIFGKLFLQFKKYLPTIIRNIVQEKGPSDSLGYYKELDTKDGAPVLQWQHEIIEGRWRVLWKTMLSYLNVVSSFDAPTNSLQRAINTIVPNKNDDYRWENLSAQQKAALIDGIISFTTMGMLSGGYHFIFGAAAGDSDDSWAKIIGRILNDYSQQYNPLELMKNILSNIGPVSGRKIYKTADALSQFIMSVMMQDLTQEGNYRGLAELKRSVPFLSSYRDIIYFLENREQENLTDYIFYRGIN